MRSTERAFFQQQAKKYPPNFFNEFTVVVSPRSSIASPTAKSSSPQSIKSPTNSVPDIKSVTEIPPGQKDEWFMVEYTSPKSAKK